MIYLLLSIIASSFLVLSFKYFERFKIDNFQAAVCNYIVASGLGFALNMDEIHGMVTFTQNWMLFSVLLGLLFISMINIIAITAQKNGVSVATVATKTSLIIPVFLAMYLYEDRLSLLQGVGIVLAILSVILVAHKDQNTSVGQKTKQPLLLPGILFIATGIADTLIKYAQVKYIKPADFGLFISVLFGVAALTGTIVVLCQILFKGKKIALKNLVGGSILGIINYGTLIFLLKTLDETPFESAVIFPLNNMGVVLFSALMAVLVFKEKLSLINKSGIAIAVIAIALITLF
jgi:drug/metabolite transporter (DMT)-like permease